MKIRIAFTLFVLLAGCTLSPLPSIGAAHVQDTAAVPRITAEELKLLVERGEAVVIDVRDSGAYLTGHVKGALSIPGDEVTRRAAELPRDKMIVTYCT